MANFTLPALPSIARARAIRPCGCGCGRTTTREFAPGHDSKLKAIVMRVVAGVMTEADVRAYAEAIGAGKGDAMWKAVRETLANKARLATWKIEVPEVKQTKVG